MNNNSILTRLTCAMVLAGAFAATAAEITDGSLENALDVTVPSNSSKNSITESGHHSNWGVANAFDGTPDGYGNRYIVTGTNYWIKYEFKTAKYPVVRYIAIAMPTDSCDSVDRAPRNWTFEGSNDNANWTVLDTEENITGWKKGVYRYFGFQNSTVYKYLKLNVTRNNGNSSYSSLGNVEFYTDDATVNFIGDPQNYGVAQGIGYGLVEYLPGGVATNIDISACLMTADDDANIRYVPISDGVRANFKGYRITDVSGVTEGSAAALSYTFPRLNATPSSFAWRWQLSYRLDATAGAGGEVRFGSGAQGATATAWGLDDELVTLTAVPADGKAFKTWSGDVPNDVDMDSATIQVPADQVRSIGAVFKEANHVAATLTFTPTSAQVDWDDFAAAWDGAEPGDGDTLIFPDQGSAKTITLTHATPALASIEIGNRVTLVVSNWTSRIVATNIVIKNGGAIAMKGSFTEEGTRNRIWIAGTTLDVQTGGKISADATGYAPGKGPGWSLAGYSTYVNFYGGAYGGYQGYDNKHSVPVTYGSAEFPEDPGTGGSYTAGGGAIRIDLDGALTVNGSISAKGGGGRGVGGGSQVASGGGSGGGIWITCASITGEGSVTANAAQSDGGIWACGAGGGRVAVHYDPTAQAAAGDCRVRFEARGSSNRDFNNNEYNKYEGTHGTLWFTDGRFLQSSPVRLGGVWKSPLPSSFTIASSGDFVFENCALRFPDAASVAVDVAGDLDVTGTQASMYTVAVSNGNVRVGGDLRVTGADFTTYARSFSVGGDVALTAYNSGILRTGGILEVNAQPTNGTTDVIGCEFTVAGGVHVARQSKYRPKCCPYNGSIVTLKCAAFTLDEGGFVDASQCGWASMSGPGRYTGGEGTGVGSSHGGLGGYKAGYTPRPAYGDMKRPLTAGSGSGQNVNLHVPGYAGGGVVRIDTGIFTHNGKVQANACADGYSPDYYISNGGSGGSVYLTCGKLLGTTGTISAKGGTASAGGAGGRVAVYYRNTNMTSNIVNVAGAAANKGNGAKIPGEDGTIYWHQTNLQTIFLVR